MSAVPIITGPPALRVGIVGYGLMGKAHSYGYRVAPLLRRQAESFASFAEGGPCQGATADDAVAALVAAEQVTAAIPAMSGNQHVSAGLPPSYRHRPGG